MIGPRNRPAPAATRRGPAPLAPIALAPVANQLRAGITLMDHPENPGQPTAFHVRADGWMGPSLTLDRPITLQPNKPLRLRYRLWIHAGLPQPEQTEKQWKDFAGSDLPALPSAGN